MTSINDSSGSMPTEEAKPDWSWLQEKINATEMTRLDDWLENELYELEEHFAEFVTAKSLSRSMQRPR